MNFQLRKLISNYRLSSLVPPMINTVILPYICNLINNIPRKNFQALLCKFFGKDTRIKKVLNKCLVLFWSWQ